MLNAARMHRLLNSRLLNIVSWNNFGNGLTDKMLGMFQIYLTMCVVDTELIKLIVLKQQMKSKEYRSSIDRRELMPLVHDK
jgi:hypothetical protein